LHSFRHVHGNEAYVEFDASFSLGFHQRAVFLVKDNELSAEFHTMSRSGIKLLDHLISSAALLETHGGGLAEVSVSKGRSDGKIQVVWSNAMTLNQRLWPVHHDWIGETHLDLRETIEPLIEKEEPAP